MPCTRGGVRHHLESYREGGGDAVAIAASRADGGLAEECAGNADSSGGRDVRAGYSVPRACREVEGARLWGQQGFSRILHERFG